MSLSVLYYDCFSGIAGDMHLGALLDLGRALSLAGCPVPGLDETGLREDLVRLGVPGWALRVTRTQRGGIAATRVEVETAGRPPAHRHLGDILGILEKSGLGSAVKRRAAAIFRRLAEAEGEVHGIAPESVHFHEVGALDALVDIVGGAILLERLGVGRILCSEVELGGGFARCEHGMLPVPTPATEALLRGVPTRRGGVPFEATTPTGAAILRGAVHVFADRPTLRVRAVGHGAGGREGPVPNLLRVLLAEVPDGETDGAGSAEVSGAGPDGLLHEALVELACNIDDMSPEPFEHVVERLFADGALDAWLTPIVMKKGRPAVQVGVLCAPERAGILTGVLLEETTTLGVRRRAVSRTALPREMREVATDYGAIPVKVALRDGRPLKAKPEYAACRRAALERGVPIRLVYAAVERALDGLGLGRASGGGPGHD